MRLLRENTRRVPILVRALIANGLIVVLGASIGTTLTKALVDLSAFTLAVMFTVVGVALSLVINYLVLRIILQPLALLTDTVDQIQNGHTSLPVPLSKNPDPDIARLSEALNTMLERLAAHTSIIETNRQQLHALSAQVITAQEEERNRIARELHDETSQSLASLLIALKRIDEALPTDLFTLKQQLSSAHELATETLEGLHVLIADLRPPLLDDLGLLPAIRWYVRQRLESQGVDVIFDTPNELPRLTRTSETALFRISQEAVNNIVKHADASEVHLNLTVNGELTLSIHDDGVGFKVDDYSPILAVEHLGIFGIRERAAALGGEAKITSTLGKGTSLRINVPYAVSEKTYG